MKILILAIILLTGTEIFATCDEYDYLRVKSEVEGKVIQYNQERKVYYESEGYSFLANNPIFAPKIKLRRSDHRYYLSVYVENKIKKPGSNYKNVDNVVFNYILYNNCSVEKRENCRKCKVKNSKLD